MCKKFRTIREAHEEGRDVTLEFPWEIVRGPVVMINERMKSATVRDRRSGKEHLFMGDAGATNVEVRKTPLPRALSPAFAPA